MSFLVPIMLFGWVPFSCSLFISLKPHRAVLIITIGGWLLLPTTGYDLPGIPPYSKYTAVAISLLLGNVFANRESKKDFQLKRYDVPMVLWCLCPFASSLSNQLGIYDGVASVYDQIMMWGIPYYMGRLHFRSHETFRDLCLGILIGGMFYTLLCLYEIRMSPQLNRTFYNFFPHAWQQHYRYGGWRPIIFMQHGLMVSLWMAISTTDAFWLWRNRAVQHIKGIPIGFIVVTMTVTTILCKSANGWIFLSLGFTGHFIYKKYKTNVVFLLILLIIPLYIICRISSVLSGEDVQNIASFVFDAERVDSLSVRLLQEDLFIQKALKRPFWGWGGFNRGWPVDPVTGKEMVDMIDAMWLITFSQYGYFGLISFFAALLIGPWLILRETSRYPKELKFSIFIPVMLCLTVTFFMFDSLVNGMINPIYTMISGTIVTLFVVVKEINHSTDQYAVHSFFQEKTAI